MLAWRAPDAEGLAFWARHLQAGTADFAGVLLGFATSAEYRSLIASEIAPGIRYDT